MLENSGPLKDAVHLHDDEGPVSPPPTTQPGRAKVFSTLAGLLTIVFAAAKPAKLSHQIPALHPLVHRGAPTEERGKCQICWLVALLCCSTSQSLDSYTNVHY